MRRCEIISTYPGPAWFALFALLIAVVGCGGTYDAHVSGNVTLDGKALERGTVTFKPVAIGSNAYGPIEPNGNYTLKTGRESGLPPGEYIVTVVSREPSLAPTREGAPPPPGKEITPRKYQRPETSGLKKTVESGNNTINLELSSQ